MRLWRVGRPLWLAVALAALVGAAAYAQMPWGFREGRVRAAVCATGDAGRQLHVLPRHVRARAHRTDGHGMGDRLSLRRDQPDDAPVGADQDPVSRDERGQPNHWVVRLTDPALFNCPFTMASDVGTIGLTPEEREHLRHYLLKGGFLWVDDFWGTAAWEHWTRRSAGCCRRRSIRSKTCRATTLSSSTQLTVEHVPQITNIQFWRSVGGSSTSERGSDSLDAHFRVIRDRHGRIMVVMTHNTDIADSWEREGEDPAFFRQFSPAGYAFGINVLLHAMTH